MSIYAILIVLAALRRAEILREFEDASHRWGMPGRWDGGEDPGWHNIIRTIEGG